MHRVNIATPSFEYAPEDPSGFRSSALGSYDGWA
jgi:hypothetical protein